MIPQRDDQRANPHGRLLNFGKDEYRRRSIIEQCIGWLKECRRIGTRFEKLAINFLAMIKVAMIQRYLRCTFSDTAYSDLFWGRFDPAFGVGLSVSF